MIKANKMNFRFTFIDYNLNLFARICLLPYKQPAYGRRQNSNGGLLIYYCLLLLRKPISLLPNEKNISSV
jgi:hypothetical protein